MFKKDNFWKGLVYPWISKGTCWYITNSGRDRCLKKIASFGGYDLHWRIRISGYQDWVYKDVFNRFHKLEWRDRSGEVADTEYEDAFTVKHIVDRMIKGGLSHNPHCYNESGKYIGCLDDLRWMFEYNCVCDKYESNVVYSYDKEGYIGFSHRARQLFRVGDKLFEESYKAKPSDYTKEEWMSFIHARNKSYNDSFEVNKIMSKKEFNAENPIENFIPFVRRGGKWITTPAKARRAAINFARHVS